MKRIENIKMCMRINDSLKKTTENLSSMSVDFNGNMFNEKTNEMFHVVLNVSENSIGVRLLCFIHCVNNICRAR